MKIHFFIQSSVAMFSLMIFTGCADTGVHVKNDSSITMGDNSQLTTGAVNYTIPVQLTAAIGDEAIKAAEDAANAYLGSLPAGKITQSNVQQAASKGVQAANQATQNKSGTGLSAQNQTDLQTALQDSINGSSKKNQAKQ